MSEKIADLGTLGDNADLVANIASRAILYGSGSEYGHPANWTLESFISIKKTDLETYFNRSICKSRNIHTKTTKETFTTLEEELTQLEGKDVGFHVNPALENLPTPGGLHIEDEEVLKKMELDRKASLEY